MYPAYSTCTDTPSQNFGFPIKHGLPTLKKLQNRQHSIQIQTQLQALIFLHYKQTSSNSNLIMTKLIVVFGATGTQGGSVVASILQHPILSQQFKIRGITRDPSKPEALALQAKGVDVVKVSSCNPIL